jgi:DNA-binding response OmpR family regulator
MTSVKSISTATSTTTDTVSSRVLIIDDDEDFCHLVQEYLAAFGYTVAMAHTGPAGLEQAINGSWLAILLDVMLPGMDGFEVLKRIRHHTEVPILMLTARGGETDQIVGLEMGADDYLAKGSSSRQMLARLRAITRRSNATAETVPSDEIVIAELHIHQATRMVAIGGTPVILTAGEYEILLSLAKAKNRIKSRDSLLEEVRERDWEVFDRSIDVQISSLRKKLGDDPKQPRFIRTIRSAGYMLVDPNAPPL